MVLSQWTPFALLVYANKNSEKIKYPKELNAESWREFHTHAYSGIIHDSIFGTSPNIYQWMNKCGIYIEQYILEP
jgi:hypothetical protein